MNKTLLIAGGASVVSLAAGAAGGYFLAKKKFDTTLDGLIELEVKKTAKYYAVQAMQAKEKPASPADIPARAPETEEEPDLEPTDAEIQAAEEAKTALTNYQGFADKTGESPVTTNNIFVNGAAPKKARPPKDPTTGRFVPLKEVADHGSPRQISPDDFLRNDDEYDQESVLFFSNEEHALLVADNEEVDLDRIGKDNLDKFPDDEPSVIYVRNDGLRMDYQVTRTLDSLTVYMGFGEDDADLNDYESV